MRLLVVEDQKKMRGFLEKGLREAGYEVDGCESAGAAEALVSQNEYDLLVLDVMLPDETGIDLARKLRGEYEFKSPVLMLTALGGTRDKIRGLDAGADDYLTKPFEFDELLARIRALLRRKDKNVEAVLRFADIEMDLIKRKVRRQGRDIELSRKEFALLEYFLRHPHRPLSRTTLSEHVWGLTFYNESNVVDVYVAMLRKKIDHPFEKKVIRTQVGIGYLLSDEEAG